MVLSLYIYLSKILPLLVMPLGIAMELILIALLLLRFKKNRAAMVLTVSAFSVLWIASMPIVSHSLLGHLERDFPSIAMSEIPLDECIIVLGGAVQPPMPPRLDIDMNDGVDRVYKASQLYRAGKGRSIIVAGGNQPWSPFVQSEASAILELLVDWGVPASAIVPEGDSRNTRENALNSLEIIRDLGCSQPLLVTSAAHMTRSVATFKKLGVVVFPVSADVKVVSNPNFSVFDFLPDAGALATTSAVIREWIGRKVYQWRDWN